MTDIIIDDDAKPCAKTYTFMVGDKEVTVTLTLENGVVTAKIDSEIDMDVNALFWGDDDGTGDFEGYTKKDSSLNMNGEGSLYEGEDGVEKVMWDGSDKISSPGSQDVGYIEAGGEKPFALSMTPEEFNNLVYFGIRATSVGEDGEDSLKLVGKPEDCKPPEEEDYFPKWEQDVSNAILVFDQTEGDTKPKPDVDGYYTVKIDNWDGSNDLDDEIDDVLAWLIENDPNIDGDSELLGVIIKGGQQDTNFYAYGVNDTNGTDPDPMPTGIGLTLPEDDPDTPNNEASGNATPPNAIDQTYDYDLVFPEDVFAA